MKKALFLCSRNQLRSPTAEQVFSVWPDVETDFAGLAPDASVPLSAEQIESGGYHFRYGKSASKQVVPAV